MKKKLLLVVLAISMLLAVSAVQAATVIVEGDSVMRVLGFEFKNVLYNIDFVYDSAYGVYGQDLDFDFKSESDAVSVLVLLNEVLNDEFPRPKTAGPNATEQFFMGAETQSDQGVLVVVAPGSEFRFPPIGNDPPEWGPCEDGCIAGVAFPLPDTELTYADFTVVPIPAAVWLLGGGLVSLVGLRRKFKNQ